MKKLLTLSALYSFGLLFFSCESMVEEKGIHRLKGDCKLEQYPPLESTPYILPFPAGLSYTVTQGNCSNFTHDEDYRYAYDFDLPVDSIVIASRSGTVVAIVEEFEDGNGGNEANYIAIEHEDGTVAYYGHLTFRGVTDASNLQKGDLVEQGDIIAKSGNTGFSTGAHLDFTLRPSTGTNVTLPVTFSNSFPRTQGPLVEGSSYEARFVSSNR